MDSSNAIERILQQDEVEQRLTTMFTPEELQEFVDTASEAERVKIREAQIAQIRQARPEVTDADVQKLRDMYDHSTHLVEVNRRVNAETGSQTLAIVAVAGAQMNEHVWKPMGEVLAPVVRGVTMGAPAAGLAMEAMGQGVHWVEGKVGDGLTELTGSKTFGETVAPSATQALLAAAPKVPTALRTTGTMIKGAAIEAVESSIAGIKAAGRDLAQWRLK
ncbi:MAG: hypothetical protein Q8R43_01435 [Alphaproteobacteria bacterium]|nr:hypothetical protein [Alphaproteobacteria bacterium]